MKRAATVIGLVALFLITTASPVLAAPPRPGNDDYDGRTVIGSIPFSDSVDTTRAGTDADDEEINAQCGAPATDASVWYEYTAPADGSILVDVSGSSYSAGVAVATGSPGSFSVIACGPGFTAFATVAGETYTILAFDDQQDGAGNGGRLEIVVDVAPPPPEVDVTVDPTGTFNSQTGSATITGSVTCTGQADFAFIDLEVRQRVGRFVISGFGSTDFTCDGTTQSWSVEVVPSNGVFKGGQAVTVTFAVACGPIECGFDEQQTTVKLRS
jgi:hypothetical protein